MTKVLCSLEIILCHYSFRTEQHFPHVEVVILRVILFEIAACDYGACGNRTIVDRETAIQDRLWPEEGRLRISTVPIPVPSPIVSLERTQVIVVHISRTRCWIIASGHGRFIEGVLSHSNMVFLVGGHTVEVAFKIDVWAVIRVVNDNDSLGSLGLSSALGKLALSEDFLSCLGCCCEKEQGWSELG